VAIAASSAARASGSMFHHPSVYAERSGVGSQVFTEIITAGFHLLTYDKARDS
jgi:hypothetical protein